MCITSAKMWGLERDCESVEYIERNDQYAGLIKPTGVRSAIGEVRSVTRPVSFSEIRVWAVTSFSSTHFTTPALLYHVEPPAPPPSPATGPLPSSTLPADCCSFFLPIRRWAVVSVSTCTSAYRHLTDCRAMVSLRTTQRSRCVRLLEDTTLLDSVPGDFLLACTFRSQARR